MNIFQWLSLIRALLFMWLASTSYSLSQLYRDSYTLAKRNSPIISALILILSSISIFFVYLAITAIVYSVGSDLHSWLITLMPVVAIPLGIFIEKFRHESISKQEDDK